MRTGAISAMYIGTTSDDAPTAMPVMIRNATNDARSHEIEVRIAPMAYKIAIASSVYLRLNLLAIGPPITPPTTAPIRTAATATSSAPLLRWKAEVSRFSAPLMTPMS
jgi:hypothetical protein